MFTAWLTFLLNLPSFFTEVSNDIKAIATSLSKMSENKWFNNLNKETQDANSAVTQGDQVNAAKELQDAIKSS